MAGGAAAHVVARELGARWGPLVAARRAEIGLSQARVAARCRVSQQTVSKIERGLMIPLDPLKLRLAAALEISPGELFPWAVPA